MKKFIQALARHELAVNNLAAASGAIGSELAKCPTQVELGREYDLQWQGGGYSKIQQLTDSKGNTKTHLWHAFNYDGERLYDDEVTEYLADEHTGCEHCARAWVLIQARKKARQELGIARRLIRYYGKKALQMVASNE
jgi:hypothetical protein